MYGIRCDDCGTIEENWGSDNPVCPRCIANADEPPYATATHAADGGIRLTLYDSRRGDHAVTLEPKRALLLGADLIRLAAEGELTIEKAKAVLWGADRLREPDPHENSRPEAVVAPGRSTSPAEAGTQAEDETYGSTTGPTGTLEPPPPTFDEPADDGADEPRCFDCGRPPSPASARSPPAP